MSKTSRKLPDAIEEKISLVRELAQIMEDKGLLEIELEDDNVSVHLSKTGSMAPMSPPVMTPTVSAQATPAPAAQSTDQATTSAPDKSHWKMLSPHLWLEPHIWLRNRVRLYL